MSTGIPGRGMALLRVAMVVNAWLLAVAPAIGLEPTAARLDFQVDEGLNTNRLVREGEVAAHLVLRSGNDPRILIAFPAGDSGVGIWFTHRAQPVRWALRGPQQAIQRSDRRGRTLYGLVSEVSVEASDLQVRQAVLSSVRLLRDYESLGTVPAAVSARLLVQGRTLSWSRDRLDGAAGYRMVIEVTHGALRDRHILAGSDGRIDLRITGLSGETPLTPLFGSELLNESAATDTAARNTLTFLAYREKVLAGSWRFQTYFGRDTLISVRLLMPVLSATAVEGALGSVLGRLSAQGEVAHEEAIGECAVLAHMERDGTRSAAAVLDYKMIDGDYLLAPVASAWLVHDERARSRAATFLAAAADGTSEHGRTRGTALLANLRLVVRSALGFAAAPDPSHLIGLKSGNSVGDWRDSENGLGGGRYPYDVNAVLVPAALEAAMELRQSGLLAPYLTADDEALLARASQLAEAWRAKAPQLFAVRLSHAAAEQAIRAYAASQGVAVQLALDALGAEELRFHALALDPAGNPIPVMHSDEGFALLFDDLDAQRVDEAVTVLMRPFPAGLMTEVGMLVANPAFAAASLQASFSRNAYHGTVVWSWQQALFAAGLARQLERRDLSATVRAHLVAAQRTLWSAIDATRSLRNSELWSWSYAAGRYQLVPFGSAAADVDESDAAQLWSTAYLAVRPSVVAVGSASGGRLAFRLGDGAGAALRAGRPW